MSVVTDDGKRILYYCDTCAVVYKNIGEVSESGDDGKGTPVTDILRPVLETLVGRPLPNIEAVHRIDQPVSGCLLVAFDSQTCSSLSSQFASMKIRKRYVAIVQKPKELITTERKTLKHLLRFDKKSRKSLALLPSQVRKMSHEWKEAILDWRLIGSGENYLFLEIEPKTGRTHQIRAQLAADGIVIKGDLKYGSKRSDPLGGIRLHAYAIQFCHPQTQEVITVTSPVLNPDPLWEACFEAMK